MSAYGDITAMATLLGGKDPDDAEAPGPSGAPFNPSALPVSKDDGVAIPAVRPGKKDTKAIWDVSELVDDFDDDSEEEGEDGVGLSIPTYEFLYKQAINTADAFLGMAHNKDPGTRSCEDMVLKISLPGTKSMRELDLEVETDRLRLRSATYKLNQSHYRDLPVSAGGLCREQHVQGRPYWAIVRLLSSRHGLGAQRVRGMRERWCCLIDSADCGGDLGMWCAFPGSLPCGMETRVPRK